MVSTISEPTGADRRAAVTTARLSTVVQDAVLLHSAQGELVPLVHATTGNLFAALSEIAQCQHAGVADAEIAAAVGPLRDLTGRSPLWRRMQTWPRGYRGDFETVERICQAKNDVSFAQDPTAFAYEEFALRCGPVQQHRNKLAEQARLIAATFHGNPAARVLCIATGPAYDVRCIASSIPPGGRVVLNDSDPNALDFAHAHLANVAPPIGLVAGNILRVYRKALALGPYDLVVAGGLFDYLNDPQAEHLIHVVVHELLGHGGRFFFTNVVRGHPYRCLMNTLVDWPLLERSEADLVRLAGAGGAPPDRVTVRREAMDMAALVEVLGS
jgi:hypothetical protein